MKNYYVYILASNSGTLYIWVTNNLERRISEHKNWLIEWFTKKYNCNKLVYFEETNNIISAIEREKQLKWLLRKKKEDLIKSINPNWLDLSINHS
jgi:putative endonuclease